MDRVVLLLWGFGPVVWSYSSGQVADSCENLHPHHSGLHGQGGKAPFTIITDRRNYSFKEEVAVQLRATGSKPFVGFLLQARGSGDLSPVGSFTLKTGDAQLLNCSQKTNSAVSHTSESLKTSVQVIWRSEDSGFAKPIQFHASFVQNYRTFWVNILSPMLIFKNDSLDVLHMDFSKTAEQQAEIVPNSTKQSLSSWEISSEDCGVTKVCFRHPSNCAPELTTNCYFMSAIMLSASDTVIQYEMTGTSDGYISFGFSDDQTMGNDDIYVCSKTSNDLVQLQHAFSVGRAIPQTLPLGNISDLRVSMQDRVISCSFTSFNPISTRRSTGVTDPHRSYYLMFAYGSSSSNGQIQVHTNTFLSANKVDISRPQLVRTAGWPHIIKAHGAMMLIAWMTTGSIGMMVARYLKGVAKGNHLLGKDVWFLVHFSMMGVTIAATVIAFPLSFIYVKTWSEGTHPVLGCLVMILCVPQLTLALLRCGPQNPLRFLFNWSHAVIAVVLKILAIAAIFTGLKIMDNTIDQWLMKVMGGLVTWEALFCILLEINFKRKVDASDTSWCPAGGLVHHWKCSLFARLVVWSWDVII
ncbi:putative ferric-chelate reductase 1 isoform X2 [Hippocampus comes]|uniref:putative ferric-chelate reductase 1 isoform X2 n=1 Tax=Hippocampus comes TaxID=109280 RepID=UPI00094F37C8|nr:PREDICTED: ferric-chelate reductase 1 isoform X2 [Hippocampus comes]